MSEEFKGRVYSVTREPGDKRSVEELLAEQCDGAVLTEDDMIIVCNIMDERLCRVEGHA